MRSSSFSRRKRFFGGAGGALGWRSFCGSTVGLLVTGVEKPAPLPRSGANGPATHAMGEAGSVATEDTARGGPAAAAAVAYQVAVRVEVGGGRDALLELLQAEALLRRCRF